MVSCRAAIIEVIDDIKICITRKKVKHLRLAISPHIDYVRVSAPKRLSDKYIQDFIVSRMPWIKKHFRKPDINFGMITPEQKKLLEINIKNIIEKYEPIMGVTVSEFRIRKMKTRWGTCNTRAKRIWINTELAKKPLHCLEYIVVHEMVHLLEKSHNHRFKAFMDKFLPEWKKYRTDLKVSNSHALKQLLPLKDYRQRSVAPAQGL